MSDQLLAFLSLSRAFVRRALLIPLLSKHSPPLTSLIAALIALTFAAGCSPKKQSSTVRITLPKAALSSSEKITASAINLTGLQQDSAGWLDAVPQDTTDFTCYFVLVGGTDEGLRTNKCLMADGSGFAYGPSAGLAAGGGTLTLDVPAGANREIMVFAMKAASEANCVDLASVQRNQYSAPLKIGSAIANLEPGDNVVTVQTAINTATSNRVAECIGQMSAPAPTPAPNPPTLAQASFASASSAGAENSGSLPVVVSLDVADPTQTVSLSVAVSGSAASGTDYTSPGSVVTFPPGSTSQTILVSLTDDAIHEVDESVILALSNPLNATLGAIATHTLTITDNDVAPTLSIADATAAEGAAIALTVSLSAVSGMDVTANWSTADLTATTADYTPVVGGTLTIPAGALSTTVLVTSANDTLDEIDETLNVTLSAATNSTFLDPAAIATITDNDAAPTISIADATIVEGSGAGTTQAVLTISASGASGQEISVNFTTSDGTATTADSDYTATSGTATIAAGSTSTTLTIPVGRDSVNESDESILVTLSGGANYTVAGSDLAATVTIQNDDGASGLSIADTSISEGGTIVFTVALSPTSGLDVTFTASANSGGTALSGSDYSAVSGLTLTIPAGASSVTFTVPTITDLTDEPDETFEATITGATNAALLDGLAIATILDADPTPTLSIADLSIAEGSPSGTTNAVLTITLSSLSSFTITTNYSTSDGTAIQPSDYTAATGTVTIAPGAGSGTLTVPVVQDSLSELDDIFSVTLSGGANYQVAGSDLAATVTITNDDIQPSLAISDATVTEGGQLVFTASLSSVAGTDVTFDWATADGAALSGSDYTSIVLSPATITAGLLDLSLTVSTSEDALVESPEDLNVNFSSALGASIADNVGIGTINDNDAAPTIVNVSSSTADGQYKAGQALMITVAFSNSVFVVGTPELMLETGAVDHSAIYFGGSGTPTLQFQYTVQAGDFSADLDFVSTTSLALNGGTIQDTGTNNAILTLPIPGSAGSLSASKALAIDGDPPSTPASLDDGSLYHSLTKSPHLNWGVATDSGSGLARYEVAIGTAPGASDVMIWTNVGTTPNTQRLGLTLLPGSTYFASVRAFD
ncbi:MAG: hypothetical protein NDI61_06825, partial [Bdellovibrionaceae bacterium]|nr:hypothetical protein [Pseudobdellovibrionaceae bacterium]